MNEKELMEKKNDLITRAEATLNKAKAEKRELTDAEMAELAEIRDNVRKIVKALDLDEFFEKIDKKPKEEAKPVSGGKEVRSEAEIKQEKEGKEIRAFANFVRGVVTNQRDDTNLTVGDNGAIIPTTIANRIIKKVYDMSPVLEKSTKYNTKGKLEIPYYDESTQSVTVAWATEFVELESNVGKFESIELTGYLAAALSKLSRSLINNSDIDIVNFIVNDMAYKFHLFIENALLNGSGSVVGLSNLTNKLTTASQTAVTVEEIIELQGNVKDIYQRDAIWIMNPATRTKLRTMIDDMGRPLLNPDPTSPYGNVLLGKPVYVSDNMPKMAAGNTSIFYGDFRGLATKFTEDISVQVLNERFATQHATGVMGYIEFDSKVEDAQKITKLVMAS